MPNKKDKMDSNEIFTLLPDKFPSTDSNNLTIQFLTEIQKSFYEAVTALTFQVRDCNRTLVELRKEISTIHNKLEHNEDSVSNLKTCIGGLGEKGCMFHASKNKDEATALLLMQILRKPIEEVFKDQNLIEGSWIAKVLKAHQEAEMAVIKADSAKISAESSNKKSKYAFWTALGTGIATLIGAIAAKLTGN